MDEAETMYPKHSEWTSYCKRDYVDSSNASLGYECAKPLSAMNIFKASSWNQTLVLSIMERLDNPVPGFPTIPNPLVEGESIRGREIYQLLGFCTKFGVACEILENFNLTTADINLAKAFSTDLDEDFLSVTSLWDGTGAINSSPDDVSLLCAYMKELPSQAFLVDFFFDKDFSKTNLVSTVVLLRDGSEDPDRASLLNVVDSIPETFTLPLMKRRSSRVLSPSLTVAEV